MAARPELIVLGDNSMYIRNWFRIESGQDEVLTSAVYHIGNLYDTIWMTFFEDDQMSSF